MRPTAAQKRRFDQVVRIGCMACLCDGFHTEPEIHHGGKHGYRDHDFTFGLCPVHHKPTSAKPGIPNRHANPIEFKQRYGTDEELFEQCQQILRGINGSF